MKRAASLVVATCCFVAAAAAHAAATVGQPAPAFRAARRQRQAGRARRLQGPLRGSRMEQSELPIRPETLQQRQHADAAEALRCRRRRLARRSIRRRSTHSDYMPPDQLAGMVQAAERGADCGPDGHERRNRACLWRQGDAAHVRDRSEGNADLRRRDRRPAQRESGRREVATNYVAAALTDARTGKAVDGATSSAYGCTIKY